MSRIRYDDAPAKHLEAQVAGYIATQCKLFVLPTRKDDVVDLHIFPNVNCGRPLAIAEIKRRSIDFEDYDTIHVSLNKMKRVNEEAYRLNCRAIFIVQFNDGIFYFEIPRDLKGFPVREGGRRDRNDPHDIESMIHFPVDQFRPLRNFK